MDARSSQWTTYRAAVRTALPLSAISVAIVLVVDAATDVSQTALVLAVILVGFVASLVVTERAARSTAPQPHALRASRGHRVTVLPVPHRVA